MRGVCESTATSMVLICSLRSESALACLPLAPSSERTAPDRKTPYIPHTPSTTAVKTSKPDLMLEAYTPPHTIRMGLAALDLHSELGDRVPEACAWQHVWSATESSPVPTTRPPPGWACTVSDAEGLQLASLERGAVLITQFRPELSGAAGLEVLLRWCNRSRPVLRLQEELAPASPLNAA